jgi:hypothetical protein
MRWKIHDPNGFLLPLAFRTRGEARRNLRVMKSAYPKTLRKARVTR